MTYEYMGMGAVRGSSLTDRSSDLTRIRGAIKIVNPWYPSFHVEIWHSTDVLNGPKARFDLRSREEKTVSLPPGTYNVQFIMNTPMHKRGLSVSGLRTTSYELRLT